MSGIFSSLLAKPADPVLKKYKDDLHAASKQMIDLQLKASTYSRNVCNLAEISDDLSQSVRNFNILDRPNHPSCTTFHNLQKTFKEQIRKRWEAQFNDDVLELFTHWKRQVDTQLKLIDAYELERNQCYEVKHQLTERCEARQRYIDKSKPVPAILVDEIKRTRDSYDQLFTELTNMRNSLDANQKRLAGQDRFIFFDKLFTALVQMQVSFEEELHLVTKKYASLIVEIKNIQQETAIKHSLIQAESPTSEEIDLSELLNSPTSGSPTALDTHIRNTDENLTPHTNAEKQQFIKSVNTFLVETFNEANEALVPDAAKEAFGLLDNKPSNKSKEKQSHFKELLQEIYADDLVRPSQSTNNTYTLQSTPESQPLENPEEIEFDPLNVAQINSTFQTPVKSKKDTQSVSSSSDFSLNASRDTSQDISQDINTLSPTPDLIRQTSFTPGSATKRKERLSFGLTSLLNSSTGHIGSESTTQGAGAFSPSHRKSSQFTSPFSSPRNSLRQSEVQSRASIDSKVNEETNHSSKDALNDSLNIIFEVDENIQQHFTRYLEDDIPISIRQQPQHSRNLLAQFNYEAEGKSQNTTHTFSDPLEQETYEVETENNDVFLLRTTKWLDDVHSAPLIDAAMSATSPKCDMRRMDLFQWGCDARALSKTGKTMDIAFTEFQNGTLPPLNHITKLLSTIQTILWPNNGLRHFPLSLLESEEYLLVFCKKTFHILSPFAEKAIDKDYTPSPDDTGFSEDEILKALISVTVLRILRSSLREYHNQNSNHIFYDDLIDKFSDLNTSGPLLEQGNDIQADMETNSLPDLPSATYPTD